jgi:hypothetical protein
MLGFITASIIALPFITDYEMEGIEFLLYFILWPIFGPMMLVCEVWLLLEAWIRLLRKVK